MKLKRLRLRNRPNNTDNIPGIPSTPHGALIRDAVVTTRKLDALRQFPACKLTADAYIAETLAIDPKASLAGVKKLRAALAKKPPSLVHTQRTLARMIAGVRGPYYPTPPVKYPGRLVTAFSTPETTAELITHGSNTIELFALACQLVAESNPEVWGTAESSAKHAQQVAELEARQAELFRQLETKVSGDDLNIDPEDRSAPVTFKASDGQVPLAPRRDAGARLVAYLLKQREQRKGA